MKYTTLALSIAVLAMPTLAIAQDPSTRTDVVVIGATLSSGAETTDLNATPAPDAPVVYEDDAATSATEGSAAIGETTASSEAD